MADQLTIISQSPKLYEAKSNAKEIVLVAQSRYPKENIIEQPDYGEIREEIVALLHAARTASVCNFNAVMTAAYWEIGWRIAESEMRGEKRAEYGEQLVKLLAAHLTKQFGRGGGKISLWRMRAFYRAWPEKKILSTALKESGKSISSNNIGSLLASVPPLAAAFLLPWSAYLRLMTVKNPDARAFMRPRLCVPAGRFASSIVRLAASFQFYERIALSRNKAAMLENAEMTESGDAVTPEEAIKDLMGLGISEPIPLKANSRFQISFRTGAGIQTLVASDSEGQRSFSAINLEFVGSIAGVRRTVTKRSDAGIVLWELTPQVAAAAISRPDWRRYAL